MTEERKGVIALSILRVMLRKRGVQLSQELPREIGNCAKETGISIDELKEFVKPLLQEVLDTALQ